MYFYAKKNMIHIDDLLREKKLSKTELTKKMGLKSRTSLYEILNGNPMLESIERLATALEVPISELFPRKVSGYIEIDRKIYKITGKKDIKNILELLD